MLTCHFFIIDTHTDGRRSFFSKKWEWKFSGNLTTYIAWCYFLLINLNYLNHFNLNHGLRKLNKNLVRQPFASCIIPSNSHSLKETTGILFRNNVFFRMCSREKNNAFNKTTFFWPPDRCESGRPSNKENCFVNVKKVRAKYRKRNRDLLLCWVVLSPRIDFEDR